MRAVATRAELLGLTGDAPVLRYEVGDDLGPAVEHEGAVLFPRVAQSGHTDLVALGPDDGIVAILWRRAELREPLSTASSLTVESRSRDALVRLGLPEPGRWVLMTSTDDPRLGAHSPDAQPVVLGPERYAEVRAFLDEHYTSRWTTPGRMAGEQWLGHERDGRLVAAGCVCRTPADVALLGGITVARQARGLGLGRSLTVALTRIGLAETGVVTLGLDEGNPVAEKLYLDLGFTVAHEWASVPLRPLTR